MALLRINAKGAITLPADLCREAGIKVGDYLVITIKRGKILMTPLASFDQDTREDFLELSDPKVQREIKKSSEDIRSGKTRPDREILKEINAEAKRKGLDKLSRRQIDAEIKAVRRQKRWVKKT